MKSNIFPFVGRGIRLRDGDHTRELVLSLDRKQMAASGHWARGDYRTPGLRDGPTALLGCGGVWTTMPVRSPHPFSELCSPSVSLPRAPRPGGQDSLGAMLEAEEGRRPVYAIRKGRGCLRWGGTPVPLGILPPWMGEPREPGAWWLVLITLLLPSSASHRGIFLSHTAAVLTLYLPTRQCHSVNIHPGPDLV